MSDVEKVHAEWAADDWEIWEGHDPFEDYVGPMYFKKIDGEYISRLYLEEKHMNGQGNLHGGMLMTFADYAMFIIVRDQLMEQGAVTVTCNSEFLAAAQAGTTLEARGELVHETGRMMFLRGQVYSSESALLSFSGVLRKVKRKIQ